MIYFFCYIYLFIIMSCMFVVFFFFQAEDGIRDVAVTGVQTCALPIFNISDTEAYHLYQAAELLVTRKFDGPLREIARFVDGATATTAPTAAPARDR